MRVLHVTNWYPNKWNVLECQFIKEHINSLELFGENELWHVQVRNEGKIFKFETGSYSKNEQYLIINTRIQNWFIIERLHFLLLCILKVKLAGKKFDATNFHIAYPLLRFPTFVKRMFGKSVVITEHWSAYRLGFNLAKGSKARSRIEKIFAQNIPVIAVSKALMNDIVQFSGTKDFSQFVVPNIVDTNIFNPSVIEPAHKLVRFLMIANWVPIKKPFLVLEAFKQLLQKNSNIELNIIGYGPQWTSMISFAKENLLEPHINFLGRRTKEEIAAELRRTTVFLHPSAYETFSVVCAEALCCGVPVVASKVGGIKEVVPADSGLLVDNTIDAWFGALTKIVTTDFLQSIDRQQISQQAASKYSQSAVGAKYYSILETSFH